ncbi:MAG: succinate dehydrogenase hydrophobic membrane anchor subunit [Actinomycetota bacterium]|nr:succinate dehydrogenase hydrophobic membrane anchor subunit [Actinomycetota bacterium]
MALRERSFPSQRRNSTTMKRSKANFETWSWFFMRISGLILFFLALIHFSITHIFNDVTTTTVAFVAKRWANPLWRVFDWLLLALGLMHGSNGLRFIMDDYIRTPRRRAFAKAFMYSLSAALFVVGTITIVTYKGTL